MRILDRYLLREFLLYLALSLLGSLVIFAVVDVFEKIDVFLDHRASPALIGRFYLYRTPEVVVQMMPVALLLSTFLSLGQLNKFGELTAMRVAGLSLLRILAPVWISAAASTAASLLLGELVVPEANAMRDHIYQRQIQGIAMAAPLERADVTYLGREGRIVYVRLYVVREARMHQPVVQEFRAGRLRRRLDAAEARWEGDRWVFRDGFLRTFTATGEEVRPFERLELPELAERPEDFAKQARSPKEMGYLELRRHVERLRASGSRVQSYLVDLHVKLAFPLVNVVLVLIAAPLATRLRMQSAAQGFGLSMIIAFTYYGLMRAGQALGHNGALPPYVAAWLADAIYGAAGVLMIRRAQRK